jgi:hypothetical protein
MQRPLLFAPEPTGRGFRKPRGSSGFGGCQVVVPGSIDLKRDVVQTIAPSRVARQADASRSPATRFSLYRATAGTPAAATHRVETSRSPSTSPPAHNRWRARVQATRASPAARLLVIATRVQRGVDEKHEAIDAYPEPRCGARLAMPLHALIRRWLPPREPRARRSRPRS